MTWELRPDEGKIALPRLQSNYSPQTVPVLFPPGLPQGRRGFVGDDSAGDFSLVPSTGPLDPSKCRRRLCSQPQTLLARKARSPKTRDFFVPSASGNPDAGPPLAPARSL